MYDSLYNEDLKMAVSFATDNGAMLSIKLLTYELDFGRWVIQMHCGTGVIEVLSPKSDVLGVLKSYSDNKILMGEKNIEYKKILFGLAGGKLVVKTVNDEDFVLTAMRLIQKFVREFQY